MTIAERLRQEGHQNGLQEGIQQGLEQGMQKGLEQGVQKVRKKKPYVSLT